MTHLSYISVYEYCNSNFIYMKMTIYIRIYSYIINYIYIYHIYVYNWKESYQDKNII